ncbi:leucine zipper putative tumor suppressor 2 [Carettochelys insculpta]|uniref:leucine zipper putative tumor suppressor 2 n=1 Tax=Carettochelys insculpta TaxID=44489 RepID=UPI003EBFB2BB
MAIVQTLPVSIEPAPEAAAAQLQAGACSLASAHGAMGSVSSLISGRPCHERPCPFRRLPGLPPAEPCSGPAAGGGLSASEDQCPDWAQAVSPISACSDAEELRDDRAPGANIRGPPPRLVPVSGQLEKNVEKTLIRPTAFKPVVPKGRSSGPGCVGPRAGALSESQASLAHLLGGTGSAAGERHNSLSCRHSAHSGTLSDSGRNSLSSLPTYSTGCSQRPEPGSAPGTHLSLDSHGGYPERGPRGLPGPSNSDSGRSSSSKSSGSLSGRGPPSSDGGSGAHSPLEGDEALLLRELEEKLREREAELQHLRRSLEENEAAICQVYEEKQVRCEQEMEQLRQSCASQVKQAAQKAQRTQQVLQLQIFQLQQEKKQLQEDFAQLLQERELLEKKCASFEREQTELGPRLEETKWEVCQKSGEISLLKQQLKESQAELAQRGAELLLLRTQLREVRAARQAGEEQALGLQEAARARALELEACASELQRRASEAELLREKLGRLEQEAAGLRGARRPPRCPEPPEPSLLWASDEAKGLQAELLQERRRGREQWAAFEAERLTWLGEKDQVITYQKQLQHNYIRMYRRNRELEHQLRQLSLELQGRRLAGRGAELCFEEIAATEI